MVGTPHPESVICWAGHEVQLKVHQCLWSGEYVANSLPAILDCFWAPVARAEIDIAMLSDEDFLVVHDRELHAATDGEGRTETTTRAAAARLRLRHHGRQTSQRVTILSEVADAIASAPYPTILELDLKDWQPWPWRRVEELARLLEPVKDRITFGGGADWNLRRLHTVDPSMPMGYTITGELDWIAEDERPDALPGVRGAYGYLDAHPLARQRLTSTPDYLRDRLGAILRLVPDVRDIHVRMACAEHMAEDGLTDLADLLHTGGMLLDLWTLNAGTPNWLARLRWALDSGADVITSDTPRELARAIAA